MILWRALTRNQDLSAGAFEWGKGYKMLDIREIEEKEPRFKSRGQRKKATIPPRLPGTGF